MLNMVQGGLLTLEFAEICDTAYGMRIPPIVVLHVLENFFQEKPPSELWVLKKLLTVSLLPLCPFLNRRRG